MVPTPPVELTQPLSRPAVPVLDPAQPVWVDLSVFLAEQDLALDRCFANRQALLDWLTASRGVVAATPPTPAR